MATEQEILSALANMVATQSKGSVLGSQSPIYGKGAESPRDNAERAKEAGKIIAGHIAKGTESLGKQLPHELQKAINKSSNEFSKSLTGNIKKMEDVLRVDDQVAAMKQISAGLSNIQDEKIKSVEDVNAELNNLENVAESAGLSLKALGVTVNKRQQEDGRIVKSIGNTTDSIERLDSASEELTNNMTEANSEVERLGETSARASKGLSTFVDILKNAARIGLEEIRVATARATADQGIVEGAMRMGISQIEYSKILAESRQTQMAMSASGIDFKTMLETNTDRLKNLSFSTVEAAQVANLLAQNAARMGVAQENLGDVVNDQISMYVKNGRAYAQSSIEAAKFTSAMLEDTDFRLEMVRLRGQERKEFVLGLAARQRELKQMGYTDERAREVVKTFSALAGMNPKDRMKQAAKKRAMMGALGLGAEGSELMDLEIRYQYMRDGEEKVKAGLRMAELQAQAASALLEKTGGGANIGQAMAIGMMAFKTGMNDVVKTFETESGKGLVHSERESGVLNEVPDALKEVKNIADNIIAWNESSLGNLIFSAIGKAWSAIAAPLLGGLFGSLTLAVLSGKAGGLLKGIGGKVMAGAGKVGGVLKAGAGLATGALGTAAAGVGAAGLVGYGAGSLINNFIPQNAKNNIGDFIGAGVDNTLSFLGNDAAQQRLKILGEINSKSTSRFDTSRAEQDSSKNNTTTTTTNNITEREAKEDRATQMMHDNLIQTESTLKELTMYLKAVANNNDQQAEDMGKLATSTTESMKFNKMAFSRRGGAS